MADVPGEEVELEHSKEEEEEGHWQPELKVVGFVEYFLEQEDLEVVG